MKQRVWCAAGVLVLCVFVGCQKNEGPQKARITISDWKPGVTTRVRAGQGELVKSDRGVIDFEDPNPALQLVLDVMTPCGWTPAQGLSLSKGFGEDTLSQETTVLQGASTPRLIVDGRGEPAHHLAVGTLELNAPAGALMDVPAPGACARPVEVTLDGKSLGTMQKWPSASQPNTVNYIVDPSGKHCYLIEELNYRANTLGNAVAGTTQLKGSGLIEVGKPVDFVLNAPQEITVTDPQVKSDPFYKLTKTLLTDCE